MTLPPVVKTVLVTCSRENAFRYFTEDFGKWWPGASHSVVAFSSEFKDSPASCDLEAKPGGKIFEQASDGVVHQWGHIIVWEPPSCLVFTWHPGRSSDFGQTVEVTFSSNPEGTLVTLTHKGWEKLGEDAESAWKSYNSGWETVFRVCFSNYANNAAGAHAVRPSDQ